MYLPLILFSLLFTNTLVTSSSSDPLLTLPKRASLQQVLVFLKELNSLMKETQPSYRLHKRGGGGCCGQEEDHGGVHNDERSLTNLNWVVKRLRNKISRGNKSQESKYFPGLNGFRPVYYDWVGLMDQIGK